MNRKIEKLMDKITREYEKCKNKLLSFRAIKEFLLSPYLGFSSVWLTPLIYLNDILSKNIALSYTAILAILAFTFHIDSSGDTVALANGLDFALSCLSSSPMRFPCGEAVVHFPIFQYLIGAPFELLGITNSATLVYLFGVMSVAWSFIAAVTFWRIGYISSGRAGGALGFLILLSGYLLVYMTSSFNEAASFTLFALLALSVISRWRILFISLIAFACTITKEVAFPFVLYFMLLSFITIELRGVKTLTLKHLSVNFLFKYKVAIGSVFAGVAVNLLFNYFRFGSVKNLSNLDPLLLTPWIFVPDFFSYLFISPAGGLIFTWFSLCIFITLPTAFLIRDRAKIWIISFALLGIIVANLGLARWFSPFGWYAWGPRLTLPFLGSIGVVVVYLINPYIIEFFVSESRKKIGTLIIFFVIAISSLPNLAVRLDGEKFYTKMFEPTQIAIESKIPVFTVQTVPTNLYMAASLEAFARDIVLPTTIHILLKKLGVTILWLGALFFIVRQIFIPEKMNDVVTLH